MIFYGKEKYIKMKKNILAILLIFSFILGILSVKTDSSAASQVITGTHGWLFYRANGDGSTIPDYQGINHYSPMGLRRAANNLLAAEKAVNKKGAEFIVYMAPNKESIYSEYMPKSIKRKTTYTRADQLCDYLEANTDLTIGYPKEELEPLGLIKMDFLAIKYLTIIHNMIDEINLSLDLSIWY